MKWLCALMFLCACQKSPPLNHFSGTAFNIPYHIQVGHSLSDNDKQAVASAIQEVFIQVDQVYNHWNPSSEIAQFNACAKTFHASNELLGLIELARHMHTVTGGRFDPALGALTAALKSDKPVQGPAGISHLQIEGRTLTKTADIQLDLDGISKGYAIDLLVEKINNLKFTNIYVEWGGEMKALGQHPTGRPWRVLLHGAEDTAIDLQDCAIATSGDQNQHFGKLTHIIDSKTQKPLPIAHRTITVKAKTAAFADALATALMSATKQEIKELNKTLPDIEVWYENGIF